MPPPGLEKTRPARPGGTSAAESVGRVLSDPPGVSIVPTAEKSQLATALATGRFATVIQLLPPKGHVGDDLVDQARALKIRGIDVISIPDGPRGPRMALSLAY